MPNEPDEPRTVTPFMLIERGDDTLGPNDEILFADFSPKIVPADTPDEVVVPKDVSVPEPVVSPEPQSTPQTAQTSSVIPALVPAIKVNGSDNPSEILPPSSSSDQKSGPSEPPA